MNPHLHKLASAGDQIVELPHECILHRTHLGTYRTGEIRQHQGIDAVGLGQLPRGLGIVAHLTNGD